MAADDHAARATGLTAAQACLLQSISRRERTMGDLAGDLLCDASNVTQLVRKLEERGLVAREPDPDDRRARRVSITPAGEAQRRTVERAFRFPAERTGRLTDAERRRLQALLGKLTESG